LKPPNFLSSIGILPDNKTGRLKAHASDGLFAQPAQQP